MNNIQSIRSDLLVMEQGGSMSLWLKKNIARCPSSSALISDRPRKGIKLDILEHLVESAQAKRNKVQRGNLTKSIKTNTRVNK